LVAYLQPGVVEMQSARMVREAKTKMDRNDHYGAVNTVYNIKSVMMTLSNVLALRQLVIVLEERMVHLYIASTAIAQQNAIAL
jgi:DNA-binding transcriptional regulator GbsR (MarR family)